MTGRSFLSSSYSRALLQKDCEARNANIPRSIIPDSAEPMVRANALSTFS